MMLVISLYLVSPAGAYLFHEVGYIDQLLFLVLFISIATFKKYKIFSITLFSSSMLIHELALFTTVPIFFTYLYLSTKNLKKSILYITPSLVLFLLVYMFFQTVPSDAIQLFKEKISNYSNYKFRNDFYTIFTNTFTGARNKLYYGINSLNQILLLAFLISTTTLIIYRLSNKQIILSLLVFSTGLLPLTLGLFGWDLSRWYFLSLSSLTVVFVIILIHYRTTFTEIFSIQSTVILYFIFYILLISNMHLRYFDGYKHRPMNLNSLKEVEKEFFRIPTR
ncbi:MAG: hypothetical protein JJV94_07495 [Sulfurospirillum sp.]|nr:hypothetical protein [Sulfurospirillum sp.]